jgi:hypothetical protein
MMFTGPHAALCAQITVLIAVGLMFAGVIYLALLDRWHP